MSTNDTAMSTKIITRKALLGGGVVTATALALAPAPAAEATPTGKLLILSKLVGLGLAAALTKKAALLGIGTIFHNYGVNLTSDFCAKHDWDTRKITDALVDLVLSRPPSDSEEHPDPCVDHDYGSWGEFTSLTWGSLPALGSCFVNQKFKLLISGGKILGAYPTGSSWGTGFGNGSWKHSSSWCTYLWGGKGIRTWSRGRVNFSIGDLHFWGTQSCHSDWKAEDGKPANT